SRVDEARAGEREASGQLATAVGLPGWHPRATGDLRAAPPGSPVELEPAHPALAVERARRAAAQADEARAHADAIPTPNLGLQASATTAPAGLALGAGVSLPLPLFDRNRGAIARARAEARRADLTLAARTSELTAELDRTGAVLALQRAALARFQTDALQRLATIRTMAETAYRSGQGGIVELLDAVDAITDAKLRELDLLAGVAETERALRAAAAGH
ncbi:MAG TPA: TolC family protein, partial [Kofleriaceae bacterium]|nr:TolC family protein [Kofleriaceae bacterium]